MRFQKKTMRQMTDRIMDLDRMYLESISHKIDKNDVLGVSTNKGALVHVAARHSPYPGTSLTRFQLLDKDVPVEHYFGTTRKRTFNRRRNICPIINMVWNKEVTKKVPGIKRKRMFERRSWIMLDNEICRYRINPLGLPLNPMGRTGLIGRGAEWQLGPNHQILAVCTRWRRADSADGQP
ncbi:TRPM2 [Mytilus coruscus]|uniref:TRPM2 n=1 Tax=Mytilus coruscus TaxID=42192 RepID=A0A6J8A112_MYTCO|nr:TRPM2 [Mytilus coruscus]